jgi:FkbM family methyltransferase
MSAKEEWDIAKRRIVTRPDTLDDYVVGEQWRSYGQHLSMEGRRVLDLGGHIGCFATLAVCSGAAAVHSYEPDPSNFSLLVRNTMSLLPSVVINAAVVEEGAPSTITLWLNVGKNTGSHSIVAHRGREQVEVATVPLSDAVARCRPSVVKCDIEGGEYFIDWTPILNDRTIDQVALELHLTSKNHREVYAPRLVGLLRGAGFVPEVDPSRAIAGKTWQQCTVWRR